MNPAQARTAAVKQLKARGAKPRKGQLRLQVGDLFWYVDPRLSGGSLVIETGCWLPALGGEPEGGAVDCPLLFDWPAADPAVDADLLVDLVLGIDSVGALRQRLADLPGVLVDKALKEIL
ncbi:hypothetical protein [Nocardioides jejuensis]|uniref:Uncharacterized protein n=1 Tax=Nocardioides jejuensis TaxID=2502782 RepID=A0A4R1CIQ3_9ACTN|nr:hypothetical protein [Nocardioides jejuensis]TCJ30901.1 hypothetical protein EPD65_02360 [Nocardioides jejuensis]